jgi:hypothetical protein
MNIIDAILIFWVVPSLVTFLCFAQAGRADGEPMRDWDASIWFDVWFSSLFYPLVWRKRIGVVISFLLDKLTKERTL